MKGKKLLLTLLLAISILGTSFYGVGTSLGYKTEGNIGAIIIDGTPPPVLEPPAREPTSQVQGVAKTLTGVPGFDWCYGCSATSAAMMMGYYDNNGFPDMYKGPTNNGVCPMNNQSWGYGKCPLSATMQSLDQRKNRGHVDDFWVDTYSSEPDPYITNGWVMHALGDCTGDYMGTNQSKYGNIDGGTMFWEDDVGDKLSDFDDYEPTYRDGCHGMKLFVQSRGYTVLENFTQRIKGKGTDPNKGFTFDDFKAEIDAGRPVMIQVTSHSMLGYGYDTSDGTNKIYIRDTWDYAAHTMTWGGSYSSMGLQHYAVTVLKLKSATPPTVQTVQASRVGPSSAQLNGKLTDMGSETSVTVKFEYGTKSGGPYSWSTSGETKTATGTFYAMISGLSNGTKYYYKAKATGGSGSAYGDEMSFIATNATAPITPNLKSPANESTVSSQHPKLEWNAVAGDVTYKVQVSEGSDFATKIVDASNISTAFYEVNDATLFWNSLYYWRVASVNAQNVVSSWSDVWYFRTASAPPPNPPSNLTATAVSTSQINVAWTDNSDNETGFSLEKREGLSGAWELVSNLQPNVVSYSVKSLKDTTLYYFRVRSVNVNSYSDYSNLASAKTHPPTPDTPTLKTPTTGTVFQYLNPSLEWNIANNASYYRLQVSTVSDFSTTVIDKNNLTVTKYDIAIGTLNWKTKYYWRVRAFNSIDVGSNWSTVWDFQTSDPTPNPPSDLVATAVSSSQINLTWKDNATNETGFEIERRNGLGSYTKIASVGEDVTSYSNTALTADTEYFYRVKAINDNGSSQYCTEASAKTFPLPPGLPFPSSPTYGSTVSSLTPTLQWSSGDRATSYDLQVSTSMTFPSTVVNATGITTTSYVCPTLNVSTTYYWRIRSVNAAGSSNWTSPYSFKTKASYYSFIGKIVGVILSFLK
ncbi:MAG TPA: fibronectin type III domain-containing protein [Caldisericia bacterium]|nr:fibronectin type III domain-containing protein [Caldisericia bacterium]HPL89483.1 fibronectin type III domain-containing protein [Caldisericia bacterium]HQG59203.1 fibronectin type III domain-containing protein [Caldisericia bacterium]HQH48353.1 fibronectin type III domain-containing protein [Caldisericia bacterium]HQJ44152.1 fibronectin type III domain-containing protein [Caldisericia bacterium]